MPRYPGAQWRGPVPNVGGALPAPRVGVVHIMQGTLSGTDAWFHNPASQVSAHFGTGKDGTLYQWVDTAQIAWHVGAANGYAIGIEHEGYSGQSLTGQQIERLAQLMDWLEAVHGIPLVLSTSRGWCGHGQIGGNPPHPECPGAPIMAQLPGALTLAAGSAPLPPPPMKGRKMIASTSSGNGYWCVTHDGAVYAYGDAQPHGGAFGEPYLQPGVTIVGIAGKANTGYWLFASDGSVFAYGSAVFMGRPDRY